MTALETKKTHGQQMNLAARKPLNSDTGPSPNFDKNNFENVKDATPRTKSRAMCAQTQPDMDAVTAAKKFHHHDCGGQNMSCFTF